MVAAYIHIRNADVKYLNIDAVPFRDFNDPYIISVTLVRLWVIRRRQPTTLPLQVFAIGWWDYRRYSYCASSLGWKFTY